ncbi:MAG: hypothetical protein WC806_04140 [Candidatus Gracilibacteria bacterium]|jgi:hypothetical protein
MPLSIEDRDLIVLHQAPAFLEGLQKSEIIKNADGLYTWGFPNVAAGIQAQTSKSFRNIINFRTSFVETNGTLTLTVPPIEQNAFDKLRQELNAILKTIDIGVGDFKYTGISGSEYHTVAHNKSVIPVSCEGKDIKEWEVKVVESVAQEVEWWLTSEGSKSFKRGESSRISKEVYGNRLEREILKRLEEMGITENDLNRLKQS